MMHAFLGAIVGITPAKIQVSRDGLRRQELWIANTLFSCLCTLDSKPQFCPALEAAVHHTARRRGSLPSQRLHAR